MANLYVSNNESNILIKIKSGNEIKADVPLFEIDYLLLTCSSHFFDIAYKNRCIDDDLYKSNEKTIYIDDHKKIKPIMFDQNLKAISSDMHKKYMASLNSNTDFKMLIDSSSIFENDISLLLNIIKNNFVFDKVKKYFKDANLDTLLSNYIINGSTKEKIIDYFRDYRNFRNLRVYLNENIYYLCLSLDNELERYKVLAYSDKVVIDEYTMKFKDSSAIRKAYDTEITDYLKENKEYLDSLSRKNNGYIVILKHGDYNMERRKVLYSDTKARINSFIKDLELVKYVSKIDYFNKGKFKDYNSIFSPHQGKIIYYKRPNIKNGYTKMLNDWKRELFEKKDYDLIRYIFTLIGDKISKNYQTHEEKLEPMNHDNFEMPTHGNDTNTSYGDIYSDTEEFLTDNEIENMVGEEDNIFYSKSNHHIIRMRG